MSAVAKQFWDANGEINLFSDVEPTVEQRMWCNVIFTAFADASWVDPHPGNPFRGCETNRRRAIRRAEVDGARAWLRGQTKDFKDVCIMAGMEPDFVRDAASRMEAMGWPPIAMQLPE